ncbi:MAG: hypothetical protein K2J72_03175, partial [Oscillospiraceae bacterium]|nr:hypothetical protein [Oscillospiraceae bacterium]
PKGSSPFGNLASCAQLDQLHKGTYRFAVFFRFCLLPKKGTEKPYPFSVLQLQVLRITYL